MSRGKVVLTAGVVIALGGLAALPFQRPQPVAVPSESAGQPFDLHGDRSRPAGGALRPVPLSVEAGDVESPALAALTAARQRDLGAALRPAEIRQSDRLDVAAPAPELAADYRPLVDTLRRLRDVEQTRRQRGDSVAGRPAPAELHGPVAEAEPRWADQRGFEASPVDAPLRRRRIADGDTLASLAERYYGDRSLAAALFQANRQVLRDPELLPIGVEIVIPPRSALPQPPEPPPPAAQLLPPQWTGESPRMPPLAPVR